MGKNKKLLVILSATVGLVVLIVCVILLIPCEHVYQGQITKVATCTEEGVETFVCEKCSHSYTQPVAMIAHSYDKLGQVLTEPTCTKTGSRQLLCTACNAAKESEMPMLDHTYGEAYISKEPNCTETGEKSAACTVCQGVFVVETLPVNDVHDIKQEQIKAATCAAAGEAEKTCSRCSYKETVALERLSHNYKVTSEVKGTCRLSGFKHLTCEGCGATQMQTIGPDPNAHKWTYMGMQGWEICTGCGTTRKKP